MSQSELIPVDEDEKLEEEVLRLRMQGLTAQQIARKTMISVPQVHAALDKILPQLDQNYRRRVISESLLICDRVISKHLETVADPESASVVIRGLCERRFWIGINSSTDPVQLTQDSKPERSTDALDRGLRMIQALRRLAAEKPSGGQAAAGPHEPASGGPGPADAS